ncbi:protein TMEPAI [Sorex fumeus]|uniref:protein TMEPAI n=1 Tax=Sorex fumeus TaxID=62283 RepID=UPI0024AE6597|nr:protein TMEPAI [Sorex fumeus]
MSLTLGLPKSFSQPFEPGARPRGHGRRRQRVWIRGAPAGQTPTHFHDKGPRGSRALRERLSRGWTPGGGDPSAAHASDPTRVSSGRLAARGARPLGGGGPAPRPGRRGGPGRGLAQRAPPRRPPRGGNRRPRLALTSDRLPAGPAARNPISLALNEEAAAAAAARGSSGAARPPPRPGRPRGPRTPPARPADAPARGPGAAGGRRAARPPRPPRRAAAPRARRLMGANATAAAAAGQPNVSCTCNCKRSLFPSMEITELEFVEITVIVVVVMVMVVVITCLLSHYKLSARSFMGRHSQARRRDDALSSEGCLWASDSTVSGTGLPEPYAQPRAPDRLAVPPFAPRDRFQRFQPTYPYLQHHIDLPPTISLSDGEEPPPYQGPCTLQLRDPEQQLELNRESVRAPPNRTVFDSDLMDGAALGGPCPPSSNSGISAAGYGGGGRMEGPPPTYSEVVGHYPGPAPPALLEGTRLPPAHISPESTAGWSKDKEKPQGPAL